MNTKYFFGHPYFHLNLKLNNTLIQSLSKKAISLKKKNTGKSISNIGGFHSKIFTLIEICPKPIVKKIFNAYDNYLRLIYSNLEIINTKYIKTEAWLNINYSSNFNSAHEHTPTGSMFSGVLFVNVPSNLKHNEGCLVFEDLMYPHPRNTLKFNQPIYRLPLQKSKKNFCNKFIKPIKGDLVLFPSSLFHSVSATFSKKLRISMAINFIDPRLKLKATKFPRSKKLYK